MFPAPQHQCLIYEGAPSKHLAALAAIIRERLRENFRCLYLNSRPMIAGVQSYLAAAGVDVKDEIGKGSLVVSAEQDHLCDGKFHLDRMIQSLDEALKQALNDGYAGLWASGDMSWEFGPEKDFSKLMEYERRLEEFMQRNPELVGICQYHADTLPRECLRQSMVVHPHVFANQTLSLINPYYLLPASFSRQALKDPELDSAVTRVLQMDGLN